MTSHDLSAVDKLRLQAGWNQRKSDWQRLLDYQPEGCFVACAHDEIVGTVTTTSYDTTLAWIGMMLVHTAHRRQGIATMLMRRAMDFLQKNVVTCIKLDATPDGEHVYRKLGFQPEWTFHRWTRSPEQTPVFTQQPQSRFEYADLDATAFGVDRRRWLQSVAKDSWWISQGDAFGMVRPGVNATYLGPIVAPDHTIASELVSALLLRCAGAVIWDIPSPNVAAEKLAHAHGFAPVRKLTRMWLGSNIVKPDLQRQFAMVDPATG